VRKGEDPDVGITNFEDLRLKLEKNGFKFDRHLLSANTFVGETD
jgi:hypothetical protein